VLEFQPGMALYHYHISDIIHLLHRVNFESQEDIHIFWVTQWQYVLNAFLWTIPSNVTGHGRHTEIYIPCLKNICVYIYIYIYMCVCVCVYIYIYIYIYIYMCVCVCVYIYIYIYIYIYMADKLKYTYHVKIVYISITSQHVFTYHYDTVRVTSQTSIK